MAKPFRINGHGDTSKAGFPTEQSIRDYVGEEIFRGNDGRYRYTTAPEAKKIVLSRDGKAYGHFDISRYEDPTPYDVLDYPPVKRVFIVEKATQYERPVQLKNLGHIVRQRGLEIDEDELKQITDLAGELREFTRLDTRYCRICFNSSGWRKPTGTADERSDSYYAENGFGHEEWLFNYEWTIDGYKYAFLQPLNLYRSTYEGQEFSLNLYTKLGNVTLLVGRIAKVVVPTIDELRTPYARMVKEGWIDQMRADIEEVEGNASVLPPPSPEFVLNARFRQEDVTLYDPMRPMSDGCKPARVDRYMLFYEEGDEVPGVKSLAVPTRSELQSMRAAQEGTVVNHVHAKMQNCLYREFCKTYGEANVGFEVDCVDLRVTDEDEVTFYELKTDTTAKRCIRNALGQLFEYATYAKQNRAVRWIVVGDAEATSDDVDYIAHLRATFQIPLQYGQFDWQSKTITRLI